MNRLSLLAVALPLSTLVPVAPASAQDTAVPRKAYPDTMLVDTLPNGLQVVIEESHATPIVHVEAFMRVGSLYEQEYLGSGLSHYMEHIVSGGSTRRTEVGPDGEARLVGRTEEENKQLLKSIGGYSNAATFYDYTKYYITTKSEMAGTAIDLISDYLQHCQFDPTEVEREQRVVQQELLRNEDNTGRFRSLLFTETMFKVHPVRVPVIGYVDCIDRITRDDMMRFYDKHYTPQNCVVSIVGDVDKEEMFALVEQRFGSWKRKPLEPYLIAQEPEQTGMRWVEKEHGSTQTCLVSMGVPSIPLQHPDLYALDMLANVLGIGASARLPLKFEHDPEREVVATQVGASNWTPVFGAGRFGVHFGADTPANARALVWEMWEEAGRLKEELVDQEEIDRALKVLEKYFFRNRADVEERAGTLASNLAWLNDPLHTDTYLENIREVTPAEIRDAARKYLVEERLNVVIVTPPQPPTEMAVAEPTESAGEVRKVVLDNGLTLLFKRIPGYGMVDVAAAFNGGVIYEDERKSGLFFLMANTFWRGTEQRPFPVLMSQMDELGMELGAESHNNVYFVKMQSLASDLEPAFDIFADVLLNPTIDPQWVEQVKSIVLTRVFPNQAVDADEILQKALRGTLYTDSPYRRQAFGSPETVSTFTAADVREIYETYTRPNNCVLALYGDIDLDTAEAMVSEHLASWERSEIPPSLVGPDPGLLRPEAVELANDQIRTNYCLGWRAFSRQDEDERIAISVMNSILGGRGWLHARLREGENDYVYTVQSSPYTGDQVGHFYVTTDFTPSDERAVVEIIDGAIEDMQAGAFTDEELELAKKMILCYDALSKKENSSVVSDDALSELYGQGYDYDEAYYEGIRAVTREDVVRVANDIFSRPALRVFVRPEDLRTPDAPAGTR